MTTFSFDTIKNFNKHIELSVPNYKHIYELVESISTYFIKDDTCVYDLGCSTGAMLQMLSLNTTINNVSFVGYEMADNLRPVNEIGFSWVKADITKDIILHNASLILSVFTLQFLRIEDRDKLVKKVYDNLNKGGAFIVCEKIYLHNSFLNDVFTFSYYDFKLNFFTEQEVLQKQRDLRFIMRPQTEKENMIMFMDAGFKIIECFFASLMFRGWILIK